MSVASRVVHSGPSGDTNPLAFFLGSIWWSVAQLQRRSSWFKVPAAPVPSIQLVAFVMLSFNLNLPEDLVYDDGSSVQDSLLQQLRRGIHFVLHRLAAENKFVFLGKGNKLYFVNLDEGGGPQEIFFEDEVWELKADSNEDVSGVQISGTSDQALVVNHWLDLFGVWPGYQMVRLLPEKKVIQLACSESHFLALTTTGEVFAAGNNAYGQLGLGQAANQPHELTQVQLRKDVSGVNHPQFGTSLACGQHHSLVVCQNESVLAFGMNNCHQCGIASNGQALVNPTPVNCAFQITKACCGAMHSLFLSSDGALYGSGSGGKGQLGQQYRSSHTLSGIRLPDTFTGRIIGIFAHSALNVSVVMNDSGRFYVSGEAGELIGSKQPMDDFFLLVKRHEVIVSGRLVCMQPETHRYRARYNVQGCCDVQVIGGAAVGEEQPRILYFGWDTIRARSPFLTKELSAKLGPGKTQQAPQVAIENYSWNAVNAYGKYLHEDDLDAEPETLLELLQLAEEYNDDTGLQSLCASVLRRKVSHENLCVCFKKSLKFKFFALAGELLKQGLNLSNACEALNIAGDAVRKAVDDAEKTMVVYIRDTVMAFAVVHAKAVVQDAKFVELHPEIAKQLLLNLANMNLLKT